MKILLLTPFLLGNTAGGSAVLQGLLALVVVFGIFGALCWFSVFLWQKR